jgi:dTDP-4-dehydrorhamnose reductase
MSRDVSHLGETPNPRSDHPRSDRSSAPTSEVYALVIGASGQVGHHLTLAARRRGEAWAGTFNTHPQPGLQALDVRDPVAVAQAVRAASPRYVMVPASAANVDVCERDPQVAYAVNVEGVSHLIQAANEVGATLVYFSSDYVFDGHHGPYDESALPNPISRYGLQKLIAEHLVLRGAREALIVRTTVVYGWEPQGKNFIYRLMGALREGREITVPSDQIGTPTYAPVLADAVFDLLDDGARGVLNVTGRALVGRDEFAREAARVFGSDPTLVRSVTTAELGQLAPRPLHAGLRVEAAEARLGRELLGYTAGLRRMLAEQPNSPEDEGLER